MPDIVFGAADGKNSAVPQELSSPVELWFSKIMFHNVSVLYYRVLCCGSIFSSKNMKGEQNFENVCYFSMLTKTFGIYLWCLPPHEVR